MGRSQADKARTHERIVAVASRRMREKGIDGIGIADLMKEAGLTVGGFYKHFGSREELVVAAIKAAFGTWQRQRAETGGAQPTLSEMIDGYLSPPHRDSPGTGCCFGALAADLARSDAEARKAATEEIRRNLDLIAATLSPEAPDARGNAMFVYSALLGALILARIVDDDPLSREIMSEVAARLKARAEE